MDETEPPFRVFKVIVSKLKTTGRHRVQDASGNDVVLAEQGAIGDLSLLELLPGLNQMVLVDPATGATCSFNHNDAYGLGGRTFAHHPGYASFVMGSNLGQLTKRLATTENCGQQWSAQPIEVGSILQFTVPSQRNALPGPVIVQAQVGIDVIGFDEVQLNLLGHSYRSKHGGTADIVFFDAHLQYWLPALYTDSGTPTRIN